jgi:methylthioribulose-1-phosphate dehydratase
VFYSTDPLAAEIAETAAELHRQGFLQATSGNLSAVVAHDPLRLLITPSGVSKGALSPRDLVCVDAAGARVSGQGRPSDELPLHLELVASAGAGAVVHTHSVWATLVSRAHAARGGLAIEGLEMLKALAGVRSHEHREWLPILPNSQDYGALRLKLAAVLREHPGCHGVLLAGHGLYAWGEDLRAARRHAEALEFLLEVVGRGPEVGSRR